MGIGVALLGLVLLVGTIGFMLIEGWQPIDAFYITALIVSTLGFTDLRPSNTSSQIFTVVIIIAGVGTLYYLVGALAQTIIENQLDRGKRRAVENRIAHLKDHYIVCGFGRVGQESCGRLAHEQRTFVVIDNDPQTIEHIQHLGYLCLCGDASDDAVLVHAGIERAQGLITAVASDAGNVYITLSARALNPHLFIVARAATTEAEHKLTIAGANRVMSPYVVGGRSMAAMAIKPSVMDFINVLMHSDDLEMWIEEIVITSDSRLVGMQVGKTQLREKEGTTILAVRYSDGKLTANPKPALLLHAGDTLIVLRTRVNNDAAAL
ncbi:MAG: potassium channel protein [Chloroflexi bacterium AL-W]|nr:potassium channel protein [Chloroflexi bacterium AL-N1]NOK69424.1 potassium channel protein [Chloroflexi bacterium AL-N10]NOK77389.1 potassium channel protein [Chloroflexi bacterium AL-N5]NOK84240.1 potassium channel protein [Chloroflexi bacterium AL-W]NOK91595.1 potassium channel protein [Chloroflexi bacterium AL-N15]